jgi:hypothetical protein
MTCSCPGPFLNATAISAGAGALHSGFPDGKMLKNVHGKILWIDFRENLHRKTPDLVGRTMAFPLISPKPSEKMLDFHRIN